MILRQSELLGRTLRQSPAGLEAVGGIWLARAGYWRPQAWLPLGYFLLERLSDWLLKGLGAADALPLAEGSLADLAEGEIRSWRHLPRQTQRRFSWQATKTRPAAGPLGAMNSPALLLEAVLPQGETAGWVDALPDLFSDLPGQSVETLTGTGWFMPHPLGTATVLTCSACGYAAERAAARRAKPRPAAEPPAQLTRVHTPGCHTIADLCAFLSIPPERTAKAIFLTVTRAGQEQVVFVVVRGDMALNTERLLHLLQAESVRPATADEIRAAGAEPGYASPVGLEGVMVVVDDLIPHAPNLVAGGNEPDWHLQNVNFGRDFQAAQIADLALAQAGDPCPHCGAPLAETSGFLLWQHESSRLPEAHYTDAAGQLQPTGYEALRLDLGRLAAALADVHQDADGLRWPPYLAPCDVHVLWLPGRKRDTRTPAEALAADLAAAGWRVLLDDREERPGVKFKDADLIGLPWRVTVGERALAQGEVEIKRRVDGQRWQQPLEGIIAWLQKERGRAF